MRIFGINKYEEKSLLRIHPCQSITESPLYRDYKQFELILSRCHSRLCVHKRESLSLGTSPGKAKGKGGSVKPPSTSSQTAG